MKVISFNAWNIPQPDCEVEGAVLDFNSALEDSLESGTEQVNIFILDGFRKTQSRGPYRTDKIFKTTSCILY